MIEYQLIENTFYPHQHLFWFVFIFTGFLLIFNKQLNPKQFKKNVTSPNIYVFEYESLSGRVFSIYNLVHYLATFLVYLLLSYAFITHYTFAYKPAQNLSANVFVLLGLSVLAFFAVRIFLSFLYLLIFKKIGFFNKIHFIRRSFGVYRIFYWYLLSFLFYFFPFKNIITFYVFTSISIIWYLFVLQKNYNSFEKHTDFKSYQLFLYLCVSEIIPFIILIWWISFQIL
jgi:hypothetical protein